MFAGSVLAENCCSRSCARELSGQYCARACEVFGGKLLGQDCGEKEPGRFVWEKATEAPAMKAIERGEVAAARAARKARKA